MVFKHGFSGVVLTLALGLPLFFSSSARAQDDGSSKPGDVTVTDGAKILPIYRRVTPLTEMQGWVKVHHDADTGTKDANGNKIKADLVFFTSTNRPSSVFTPNVAEKNPEERKELAHRNLETFQITNEPFKTLLDSKFQRTDPLFVSGALTCGNQVCDTNGYRDELKSIRVTSIKVKYFAKENKTNPKGNLDIYSTPDEKSQKWAISIVPESMVTITNVVGDASKPTFYQIAIPTEGGLPLVGYVKCEDLKVGHSADLLARLGRLFTIGIKTGLVGPRNVALEGADRVVDTADKVEDTVEGAAQWIFDEGGNVVRAAKDIGGGLKKSFGDGNFGTHMTNAADKAHDEFSKTPGLIKAIEKANKDDR